MGEEIDDIEKAVNDARETWCELFHCSLMSMVDEDTKKAMVQGLIEVAALVADLGLAEIDRRFPCA